MANWDVLFYTRSFPSMDSDRSMRHVSKLLTYPLTIASVLHQSSPYKYGEQVTAEGMRSISGKKRGYKDERKKGWLLIEKWDSLKNYFISS